MDKHKGMLFLLVELCLVITLGNGAPVPKTLTQNDAIIINVDTGSVAIRASAALIYEFKNQEYLKKYNYLSKTISGTGPKKLAEAVRAFQEMANLKVTGELNSETLNVMTMPRCGFQDINKVGAENYVAAYPWPTKNLSWKIGKYSKTSKLTQDEQKDAMARALDLWANKTQLKFSYVNSKNGPSDITIKFATGDHGDGDSFDGPYGILAHASFPTDGSVHFDDDETWFLGTKAQRNGIELFIVAAHEFGHTLGLDHTNIRGALMYPYYSYSSNLVLHQDDIAGIQSLYGKPKKKGKKGKKGKQG